MTSAAGASTTAASRAIDAETLASIQDVAPILPAGLPMGLRNYWYPVLQSEELAAGKAHSFTVLGEELVAWRGRDGSPQVLHDRCPHRSINLSVGRIFDGELQCILHGMRFNGEGQCVMVPWEENDEPKAHWPTVNAYPARELGGYIWTYLGDTEKFPPPPLEQEVPEELTKPDEFIWFRLPTEVWNCNWLLAIDGSDAFHTMWLTDFPMFEYDLAAGKWVPAHHPFTAPIEADMKNLETDPASVRANCYDLALNGLELGSGSIRIHRKDVQQAIFRALGISEEEARARFGFFLDALEYGTPPHGGIALGLDRIVMLLAGAGNLREVIAFPKTAKAIDLMAEAPTPVSEQQLKELHIRVALKS